MRYLRHILLVFVLAVSAAVSAEAKFSATIGLNKDSEHFLSFKIEKGAYLYADSIAVRYGGTDKAVVSLPKAVKKYDPFSEAERDVYPEGFTAVLSFPGSVVPDAVTVDYQGCDEKLCFPPQSVTINLSPATAPALPLKAAVTAMADKDLSSLLSKFRLAGSHSGYLSPEEFLSFLDDAATEHSSDKVDISGLFVHKGMLMTILIIILFGAGLNLTPCVLPMIPVNLAIIGAGVDSSSRSRGFFLGLAYGAGMAVFYGLLGAFVIKTGATFGVLNSSPWFNAFVALLFAVMALGMFDIITIDISRFQSRFGTAAGSTGRFGTAFLIGGVSALLAGACVAPVVISVLIFSTDLYARGNVMAFVLPFLLGVGMALPWPLAGAGLSLLPKPGAWMVKVKYVFGAVIAAAALYYGRLAYDSFSDIRAASSDRIRAAMEEAAHAGWNTDLKKGLTEGLEQGKPVFIDLWATWCKSCMKMEKVTFRDNSVGERLQAYVKVKFQAEDPRDQSVKDVMDHFKALGLPTYVVLKPKTGN